MMSCKWGKDAFLRISIMKGTEIKTTYRIIAVDYISWCNEQPVLVYQSWQALQGHREDKSTVLTVTMCDM